MRGSGLKLLTDRHLNAINSVEDSVVIWLPNDTRIENRRCRFVAETYNNTPLMDVQHTEQQCLSTKHMFCCNG